MHESLLQWVFYIFAGMSIFSALMVITQNNPVRCVLFLVLTFILSSVLWMLAGAEFLALILVLVYVGAVMTLFLFVVMMLNVDIESMKAHFMKYLPFGLMLVALLVALLWVAIPQGAFQTGVEMSVAVDRVVNESLVPAGDALPENISNTESLGMVLYTDYVFAFEIAAVILLVAIVAAITLVHRRPMRSKQQNVVRQIMTRPEDRLELVKMKPENT
ncbi:MULTISPECIES: NADH-quinone oxidoreductase subunit J [Legionella]|uniref:NADH-quinone oxidoreductase subunit J n=1 Tax=Legionella septentrionalis TaxID=2498109 RepID=A0A3S0XHD0_9GAMM|nr:MULTISPECIES: NADH-quinone oxidoreductase subunit J [Legionella]MCP0912836.1 NADH-quinone oxidoreductase subunit J [Legionella sp. 27cVA30]RUQ90006.1 NADH-quinone oxidoreductase subunit J [Legionella septentrionalis]RUQ97817.1 NADH-quinone oxidoreductase subunit J [Legionella septentrionalis]RUR11222.1 NADH-quinone oxidoreductase subunit J [Legionella septentrionalis]RUR16278.1 NADH-quinone oxidoreductase subunit J [Legionella septentrionalis]